MIIVPSKFEVITIRLLKLIANIAQPVASKGRLASKEFQQEVDAIKELEKTFLEEDNKPDSLLREAVKSACYSLVIDLETLDPGNEAYKRKCGHIMLLENEYGFKIVQIGEACTGDENAGPLYEIIDEE